MNARRRSAWLRVVGHNGVRMVRHLEGSSGRTMPDRMRQDESIDTLTELRSVATALMRRLSQEAVMPFLAGGGYCASRKIRRTAANQIED